MAMCKRYVSVWQKERETDWQRQTKRLRWRDGEYKCMCAARDVAQNGGEVVFGGWPLTLSVFLGFYNRMISDWMMAAVERRGPTTRGVAVEWYIWTCLKGWKQKRRRAGTDSFGGGCSILKPPNCVLSYLKVISVVHGVLSATCKTCRAHSSATDCIHAFPLETIALSSIYWSGRLNMHPTGRRLHNRRTNGFELHPGTSHHGDGRCDDYSFPATVHDDRQKSATTARRLNAQRFLPRVWALLSST